MIELAAIAHALGGEISGGQVRAPGPGHSASDRSLSVKLAPDAPDGFLVHSFAGDDPITCKDYVREKLGIKPKEKKKKGNGKGNGKADGGEPWKLIREHIYRTADGTPHLRKRKMIDAKGEEQFPQAHWDGKQWVKVIPKDWPKLLYRLPELLKAPMTSNVYLTEGERDTDSLANLDFVATTAGGVSSAWTPELIEPLRDRRVAIIVDSDEPGRKYGEKVARALDKIAASLKVIDLYPERSDGSDVSDFLVTDRVGVKFAQAVKDAPAWEPRVEKPKTDDEIISELAALPPLDYERCREAKAQELGVRVSALDKLVAKARGEDDDDDKQGRVISFPEIDPWPEVVDGAELLNALADVIGRHVIMSEHARDIAALWVAHTFVLDQCFISPRLAVISPTKQCGKTTLLDMLACLVLKPLSTANVSAAAVFRTVEGYRPCLLVDEGDTFLKEREELRGVLNSGHRRGGSVLRTVGDGHEPRAFSTFSACAVALIGRLPDTLADRSVTITLKRRLPSEPITPLRLDRTQHLHELARKIARWTGDHAITIGEADPDMPDGLFNRKADNWRALLAIADAAGGEWPERSRKAARADCEESDSRSRLEQLIADIQTVWPKNGDRLLSADLINGLVGLPEGGWSEYGKSRKPISQVQLARLLKPLGIAPDLIRAGEDVGRGYLLNQFAEAFQRYGSYASSPEEGVPRCYTVTNIDEMGTSDDFQGVTPESDVTGQKSEKSNNDGLCNAVTGQKGVNGEEACTPAFDGEFGEAYEQHTVAEEQQKGPAPRNGFDTLGAAPAGERCDLCGKSSGVMRVRQRADGQIFHMHAPCAKRTIK